MNQETVLLDNQFGLWVLAILLYGVGDTTTTVAGVRSDTVREIGAVASLALEHGGLGGLLVLKVGFCVACVVTWYRLETPGRVAIPLALVVTGAGVTGWNLLVLLL